MPACSAAYRVCIDSSTTAFDRDVSEFTAATAWHYRCDGVHALGSLSFRQAPPLYVQYCKLYSSDNKETEIEAMVAHIWRVVAEIRAISNRQCNIPTNRFGHVGRVGKLRAFIP